MHIRKPGGSKFSKCGVSKLISPENAAGHGKQAEAERLSAGLQVMIALHKETFQASQERLAEVRKDPGEHPPITLR